MGTLLGHVIPGTFMGVFGIWWCLNIFRDYYRSKFKNAPEFINRPWYPIITRSYKLPVESVLKLGACAFGMISEYSTALDSQGNFTQIGNAQHMTMYFFFGLNGITDLLMHYGAPLPEGLEALTAILAFVVEGLIFYNHLHGRTAMDIQLHMFLFYVIIACAMSVFLEIYHRHSVIPSLCRAFFTMAQASWFYQVGFTLYPPANMSRWDESDHNQMMLVTLIFTWHLGINLVVLLILGVLVRVAVLRGICSSMSDVEYQPVENRSPLPNTLFNKNSNSNGKSDHKELLQADSEEENFS